MHSQYRKYFIRSTGEGTYSTRQAEVKIVMQARVNRDTNRLSAVMQKLTENRKQTLFKTGKSNTKIKAWHVWTRMDRGNALQSSYMSECPFKEFMISLWFTAPGTLNKHAFTGVNCSPAHVSVNPEVHCKKSTCENKT